MSLGICGRDEFQRLMGIRQTVLNETLEEQVLAVPKKASEGLEELALKRKELVEELSDETTGLAKEADSIL